ncbi:hypothetical protein Xant_09150 [Xanthomonas cissicola]|uniref:Uncharacterized protein n=1 Tax=Xanthomonas cissicola TaxID=86186 RepID=A0ABX3LXV7_9XANT|nr:hypothetical protein Xant_09150 [Xanthomonas cissicola]
MHSDASGVGDSANPFMGLLAAFMSPYAPPWMQRRAFSVPSELSVLRSSAARRQIASSLP